MAIFAFAGLPGADQRKKPATFRQRALVREESGAPLPVKQRYASLSWIISSRRLKLCIFKLRDFSATKKKAPPKQRAHTDNLSPVPSSKPFELGNHRAAAWLCWQRDMIGMSAWLLKAVTGIVVLLLPD
ncbi:hypothetical protein PU724_26790 [Mesorhizobium abyssinicae]